MFNNFKADLYLKDIYELTPELLKKYKINALVADLDNTIAAYDTLLPDDTVFAWFKALDNAKIPIAVVSNNNKTRVSKYCKPLGIPHFWKGGKPRTRVIRAAMKELGAEPKHTAMIGDKAITDVWGAHRCGIRAIQVLPISPHMLLRLFIRKKKRNNGVKKEHS